MDAFVLAKYKDNWADEMDLHGFRIFTLTDWNSFVILCKSIDFTFELYWGTNEEVEYKNGMDLVERISTSFITLEDFRTIKKLFPNAYVYGWGDFPDENRLKEILNQ